VITAGDCADLSRAWNSGVVAERSLSSGGMMPITAEIEAEIIRLFHAERWRRGTIARQFGLHPSTIYRIGVDFHVKRVVS
jgi:hypothetical protein